MMKRLIIALLGAALFIAVAPAKQETPDINNIVHETANVEQARKPATQEVAPLQEKTPEPPVTLSESVVQQGKKVVTQAVVSQPITDNETLMQQAGIPAKDWSATSQIVLKESTWCYKRKNGDHRACASIPQPTLAEIGNKAYGLCQALPATKMASEGADYLTNPVTQLRWCHKYAQERYKGWHLALAFWNQNRWW